MEDIITLEKDNLDWWESEDFNYDELDDPDVFAPKQETNTVISGQEHDIVQPEITEEGEDPFFRDDRDNFYPETVDVNPDVLRQIDERLRSLSMKDYEQSQFDVHGLSKPIEETPEMIQESLDKLDLEIQKLKSTSQGKHYRMAEAQSAEFCQDRTFRIRFLRSTCFDVKAAAKRAVLYFTAKLDLWGKDKLCKKISLGDFTKDDLETLQNGHLQILPVRDQGGRALCFFNYNNIKMKEKENQVSTVERNAYYSLCMWVLYVADSHIVCFHSFSCCLSMQ